MRLLSNQPSWLLASFIVVASAQASEQVPPVSPPAPVAAGQTVTIDAVTGQMRAATPQERKQLQQDAKALKKSQRNEPRFAGKKGFVAPSTEAEAKLTMHRLGKGGTGVQVPESYMNTLTANVDGHGQLHVQHADELQPVRNDATATPSTEATDE